MVFKGQDAWRKHPLLANCFKTPFPAFGTAVKIFAAYLVIDCYVSYITAPPASRYRPTVKYTLDPETRRPVAQRLGGHH